MISNLNLMNFNEEIAQGIVLVYFWASWCQACLNQNPVLEEIAKEVAPHARIFKVDVSDNRFISNNEGVKNIPMLILYQNANQISRFQGIQSKEVIIRSIFKLI